MRGIFLDNGVPFAETPSLPILLIPIYETNGVSQLWDSPNPWRDVWKDSAFDNSLLPIIVPSGDFEDIKYLSASQAINGNLSQFETIMEKPWNEIDNIFHWNGAFGGNYGFYITNEKEEEIKPEGILNFNFDDDDCFRNNSKDGVDNYHVGINKFNSYIDKMFLSGRSKDVTDEMKKFADNSGVIFTCVSQEKGHWGSFELEDNFDVKKLVPKIACPDVGLYHECLYGFLYDGKEVEVDAVCDGESVLIPGIMEHVERAGVHSGDSMAIYPGLTLTQQEIATITDYTTRIGKALKIKGLIINKFRGDTSLFDNAHGILEDSTGVPLIGVIPWCKHASILPKEDSSSLKKESLIFPDDKKSIIRIPLSFKLLLMACIASTSSFSESKYPKEVKRLRTTSKCSFL